MSKKISMIPFVLHKEDISPVMCWGKGEQGQLGLG